MVWNVAQKNKTWHFATSFCNGHEVSARWKSWLTLWAYPHTVVSLWLVKYVPASPPLTIEAVAALWGKREHCEEPGNASKESASKSRVRVAALCAK